MIGEKALRAILVVIAAFHVLLGLLALLDPHTFFDEIGLYGVENSHYVGDVGAFYAAYGAALAAAVTRPSWRAPLLWLGAFWYGVHAINHAFDTGEARNDERGWSDTVLIALGAAGAAWLARVSERLAGAAGSGGAETRR
jgi:hypothetical protein